MTYEQMVFGVLATLALFMAIGLPGFYLVGFLFPDRREEIGRIYEIYQISLVILVLYTLIRAIFN
jgi:hypothetical protein